jgi:hypothetical protein
MRLQAYNNDAVFREQVLAEIKRHEDMDAFVDKTYGRYDSDTFRGCAIGCTINSLNLVTGKNMSYNSHADVAELLCVPIELCRLVDGVFESMPSDERRFFTRRVWSAIRTGADTTDVTRKFLIFVLQLTLENLAGNTYEKIDDVRAALRGSIAALNGEGEWKAAYSAASYAAKVAGGYAARVSISDDMQAMENAAKQAAKAAADAAYAANAEAGAYAASWAANAAADAADAARFDADADYATRTANTAAVWNAFAEKLIELLADCEAPAQQQ